MAAVAVGELHGVRQKESDLENNSADEADNGPLSETEEDAESTSSSDGDYPRHNDAVRNFRAAQYRNSEPQGNGTCNGAGGDEKDSEGDPAALRYENEVAGERPAAVAMLLIRESWRLMTIRGTRRNRAKMSCLIP